MGIARLMKTFRVHWGAKVMVDAGRDADMPMPPPTPSSLPETPQREAEYERASGISKRQLEKKILAIATKEQRQGDHRPVWYVHGTVLQQYGIDPEGLTPLVPMATPFSEKKQPHSCEKTRQVSPETPFSGGNGGSKKKGIKRKTGGMQSVKTLFEALAKSPPGPLGEPCAKKAKVEPPSRGLSQRASHSQTEMPEPPIKRARLTDSPSDDVIILDNSGDVTGHSKENTAPITSDPVLPSVHQMNHKPEGLMMTHPPLPPSIDGTPAPLQECTNAQGHDQAGSVTATQQGIDWQAIALKDRAEANVLVVSADVH